MPDLGRWVPMSCIDQRTADAAVAWRIRDLARGSCKRHKQAICTAFALGHGMSGIASYSPAS